MQGHAYFRCYQESLVGQIKIPFVDKDNKKKLTIPLHCEYWKSNPPSGNSYPLNALQT